MSVQALSIAGRVASIALAATLSACAAAGPSVRSPELLASHSPAVERPAGQAALDTPTDVAGLPDGQAEVADPLEKMNRSVFERNQRINHALVYPVAKA